MRALTFHAPELESILESAKVLLEPEVYQVWVRSLNEAYRKGRIDGVDDMAKVLEEDRRMRRVRLEVAK